MIRKKILIPLDNVNNLNESLFFRNTQKMLLRNRKFKFSTISSSSVENNEKLILGISRRIEKSDKFKTIKFDFSFMDFNQNVMNNTNSSGNSNKDDKTRIYHL